MSADTVVILLAAGTSSRMGGIDKLWADLDGMPVIAYALRTLAASPDVQAVVIVAPRDQHAALRSFAAVLPVAVQCVEGGARRQDSVAAGLAAEPDAEWYVVHDGARPLASIELCARVLDAARVHGAAIPALPVADTIKRVDDAGLVTETIARDSLRAVQTPQAFAGPLLRRAHEQARATGVDATDDASLIEALGERVTTVPGEATNLKITTPDDLGLAHEFLARMRAAGMQA